MPMQSNGDAAVVSRRAIEALRSGVPNRDAVRELGSSQPEAEQQFIDILERSTGFGRPLPPARGMLVSGDFGAGKSHLLAHFEQLALSRNFVSSRVVISKETPLYDLGKVFVSAVENGKIPGRNGRFMEELSLALKPGTENYDLFSGAIAKAALDGDMSMVFPATRIVHERSQDQDIINEIESFWAGDRIAVASVRKGLRSIGEAQNYRFSAPKAAELPLQRLRFAAELIRGAGYAGWVIFLDEIELIGNYSILQRGRSYAEIAHWMGRAPETNRSGLISVGAVTGDFVPAVIDADGKQDGDKIVPRLRESARYENLAGPAEGGMEVLKREVFALQPVGDTDVAATLEKLREIYAKAYNWHPPSASVASETAGYMNQMRYKVRSAINEWDLLRLRPGYRPDIEAREFQHDYGEDSDLEKPAADNAE
ncbi:MAG: hypothetical protein F4Y03_09885 [Alphaproteobacteria bacterium]|nr:hypothetical protein [Alphaproteobacteria bacterium]